MADTTPTQGDDFEDGLHDDGLAAGTFDRLPEPPPGEKGHPTLSVEVFPHARPTPVRRSVWHPVVLVLVAAIAGAGTAITVSLALQDDPAPPGLTVVERVETQVIRPSGELTAVAAVARQVLPSIVTVEVSLGEGDEFVADASGSGVVYDPTGHIVTNSHVVEGAVALRVIFSDGRTYDAELIGRDPLTDVAVLRVAAVELTPIVIGSSRDLSIGDQAIAVGSPLGLEGGPSVTTGVLSAFDRRVLTVNSELFGMLQTDAPITRGSSGGALVDGAGRLIGITTAFGVSDVGAEGLGFAIPVELVMRVADDIIATGVASHAFLGISGSTHFETLADGALAPAGVEVAGVIPGTAADLGGIDSGDIILTVGGEPVTTLDGLVIRLRFFRVGDSVVVQVLRGIDALEISIVLLERPEDL